MLIGLMILGVCVMYIWACASDAPKQDLSDREDLPDIPRPNNWKYH